MQSREEMADRPPGIAAGMKHSYKILPLFNEILWKQKNGIGAITIYKAQLFRTKMCLVRGGGGMIWETLVLLQLFIKIFLRRWKASFYSNLLVFMGLAPARRTNKQKRSEPLD